MSLVLILTIRINDKYTLSIKDFNSLPTVPFLWIHVSLYFLSQILLNRNYVLSNYMYIYYMYTYHIIKNKVYLIECECVYQTGNSMQLVHTKNYTNKFSEK